jgi:peptide-methionine (S)-S-oxide reductase
MSNIETATLAGGCFWCIEAVFTQMKGVQSSVSGFMGGAVNNPSYEAVCDKTTGHAEVIQLQFDPTVVSYETLLKVFFTAHDPTTPNRQGNDVGPQYRSAIFYHSAEQEATARRVIAEIEKEAIWQDPIVTEINPVATMWPADQPHQGYFERVGSRNPYCAVVIAPKVSKFKKQFAHLLK